MSAVILPGRSGSRRQHEEGIPNGQVDTLTMAQQRKSMVFSDHTGFKLARQARRWMTRVPLVARGGAAMIDPAFADGTRSGLPEPDNLRQAIQRVP
jgi:hypothetical protein